jgi:hypothetical protein
MGARARTVNNTTATELRCTPRTLTGSTGSLLTIGLTTTTTHIRTLLDLVRACAALGELVTNSRVEEVFLHLYPKDRLVQLYRADRLLVEIYYI